MSELKRKGQSIMATKDPMVRTLWLMGLCLVQVQQTERALAIAVEDILSTPDLKLMEQTDSDRKETIGVFLKRLKGRVRLETGLKKMLYRFLEMRNTFVHNLSEVPGWNLDTEAGRDVANKFVLELFLTAGYLSMLFNTLMFVSAKDDYGVDLLEELDEKERKLVQIVEKNFGPAARKLLAGRNRKPSLIHTDHRA